MAWTVYSKRWQDARNDSDADYRDLGKWVSDRLTDLGWGKTADTGQIDWSTATRPGAPTANTIGGYEIRVSSGAGTDIYLKISYGMGYNTTCHGFWIQTGEGSNGSGTLTGDTTTQREMGSVIETTSPYDASLYVCGDTDNFILAGSPITTANSFACGVQRTCDASGTDTNTGWYQWGMGYANVQHGYNQYVSFAGGAATADNVMSILHLSAAAGGRSIASPCYVQNGSQYVPLRDCMALAWFNSLMEWRGTHYGTERTYLSMGYTTSTSIWGATSDISWGIGIRVS